MDQENCRWYKKYDDRRLNLIYKSCSSVFFYHFWSFKENSKLCIQPEAGQHDHKVYSSRNTALFTAKGEYKTVVRIWQQQNSQQGNLIPKFTSRPKLCSQARQHHQETVYYFISLCCQKHQQHKSITQHGYD